MPELGYVYVITTKTYECREIYKIGCTKDVKGRLKNLNATRLTSDEFYIKLCVGTHNYFKLESELHKYLAKYRLNNEFFKCSVDIIEHSIAVFANNNVSTLHFDKIFLKAKEHNLRWFPEKQLFSLKDDSARVFLSEQMLVDEIKLWISDFDLYSLHQYFHPNHFTSIILDLKRTFNHRDIDIVEDLSYELNKLFLSGK